MSNTYSYKEGTGIITLTKEIDALKLMTLLKSGWCSRKVATEFGLDDYELQGVLGIIKKNRTELEKVREESERKYYSNGYGSR